MLLCEYESGAVETFEYTYYGNGKVKTQYCKNTNGERSSWSKSTYDIKGNLTYIIDSDGVWTKYSYDSKGNKTYYVKVQTYASYRNKKGKEEKFSVN